MTELSASAAPLILAPWETYEGWMDEANSAFVAGWAWDYRHPNDPVSVEVYDGNTLLATVIADSYRQDLKDVGKGSGRHGYEYVFAAPIADRRPHRITVRVAGTPAVLRDTATGAMPQPVTRRDRPRTAPVQYVSLPPAARWFYFTALRMLLHHLPRPTWHRAAMLLTPIYAAIERDTWRLGAALSEALGQSQTSWARLRTHWRRCYLRQSDLLLLLQSDRLTRQWAEREIRCDGTLPPGGAVLIAPHHAAGRLGNLRFAAMVQQVGAISATSRTVARDPWVDPTLSRMWQLSRVMEEEACGTEIYPPSAAGRRGLRLLRNGGYLIIQVDTFLSDAPRYPFLGRSIPLAGGAAWFAQYSGKPIIPWMVVPQGHGWRLWLGKAVPPTQEGILAGLAACIRQSPASWQRIVATAWMEAPVWQDEEGEAGRNTCRNNG